MKTFYQERSTKTFVIFVNKSYGDTKRNQHITFQTDKPGNVNSLTEII